jgi:hypothetical protein
VAVGLVAVAGPAQALGWSGQRCDSDTGATGDGWTVCVQYHTVQNGSFVWVDTVQMCETGGNNHVAGTKLNSWASVYGSAWGVLPNTGKNQCVYDYPTKANAGTMGVGACMVAKGTINLSVWTDTSWKVRQPNNSGGSC